MGEEPESTRDRLVRVAVEMLGELSVADLVAAMRTREIARRAGVSPATFFHHFADVEAFGRAVVDRVYDLGRFRGSAVANEMLEGIRQARFPIELGYEYHQNQMSGLSQDPEFRTRIGLWALGGTDLDDQYRAFLGATEELVRELTVAVLDSWGREPRPPLDVASYQAMQVALLQGAAIRHLVDPELLTTERFRTIASGLTYVQLRVQGDRRSMDDRLSEMNYYPGSRPVPATSARQEGTRAKVTAAAADLFGTFGYEATTITQVAKRAEVSPDTVYQHFRSKDGLGLALLERQAEDFFGNRPPDDAGTPLDRLREHLVHLASFTATHTELSTVFLAAVAGADPAVADHGLQRLTAERVAEAAAAGALRGDVGAGDLADVATTLLLQRALGHAGDGSEAVADWTMQFLCPS